MGFPTKAGTNYTGNEKVDRLLKQLDDVFKKSNAGWKRSRKVRFHQFKQFIKFIGGEFEVENIRDIKPSHVRAFIKRRKEKKIRENTLLSDLSTIRFWHKQIPLRKYDLPENSEILGEGKLRDRTWKR